MIGRYPLPTYKNFDFDTDLAKFSPKQMEAVRELDKSTVKYLLYGGAQGGGKSYFLRWYAVRYLMLAFLVKKLRWVPVMIACEDYPALKDRQISKIEREFPAWLGRSYTDHKAYGRCFILSPKYGNGVLCLRNLDDPSKYQSTEFAFIGVDELTKNPMSLFNDLRRCNRWKGIPDWECKFVGATNPGGIGHSWVRNLWMLKSFPKEFYPPSSPVDYRTTFKYVQALASDNPHLDAGYWNMLSTLPESMRKAFRDGDWNTFVGQMFTEWDEQSHVIDPIPVPPDAPIYVTMDWGFGKPFSMGWWWVDHDGRLYRFHEKYGWSGIADAGLRLSDDVLADTMSLEEQRIDLKPDRILFRFAGHDCFARRPNPFGGGQGPSTAEVFAGHGLTLIPGDPDRRLKLRQFHNRLTVPEDGSRPMIQVYRTCDQFIRTIPDLVVDKNNMEDVDTKGEDHIYDEACHIMMSRPIRHPAAQSAANSAPADYRGVDTMQIVAQQELKRLRGELYDSNMRENEAVMARFGL